MSRAAWIAHDVRHFSPCRQCVRSHHLADLRSDTGPFSRSTSSVPRGRSCLLPALTRDPTTPFFPCMWPPGWGLISRTLSKVRPGRSVGPQYATLTPQHSCAWPTGQRPASGRRLSDSSPRRCDGRSWAMLDFSNSSTCNCSASAWKFCWCRTLLSPGGTFSDARPFPEIELPHTDRSGAGRGWGHHVPTGVQDRPTDGITGIEADDARIACVKPACAARQPASRRRRVGLTRPMLLADSLHRLMFARSTTIQAGCRRDQNCPWMVGCRDAQSRLDYNRGTWTKRGGSAAVAGVRLRKGACSCVNGLEVCPDGQFCHPQPRKNSDASRSKRPRRCSGPRRCRPSQSTSSGR